MCSMTLDMLVRNACDFEKVLGFSPCSLSHQCILQELNGPQRALKKWELPNTHVLFQRPLGMLCSLL